MILFGLMVAAYFLGAIPFGLIIARSKGVDIRAHGSGNIGATNVYRVMGKSWGLFTFFLDALKGFIPAYFFVEWSGSHESFSVYCGLMAIIGHSFPIYLRFKGGKGVATSAGMLLGVAPYAMGIGLISWMVLMVLFRYVSLASILATLMVSVTVWIRDAQPLISQCLITLLSLLIVWLHRANIERLLKGTENRFGKKGAVK
ncbi:MAG: glycerol-3-phosphate 1-O-acyltransferase PlsY [Pontiellaceae bacterium]|nr:acyl-phosphate glycerol 3-phosphate acyltransferase [Verrucomicrobiota bacterium]|tara:strand:- start:530 stop:1132 length:603 start_codon:yes stop_codon:yes gene_type:complete